MDADAHYPVGASITLADLDADPHPALRRLRATEPVSWVPAIGGWLVTRRDLALAVLRDARTFTVDDPRFSTAQVVGPSMLSTDGAEHSRHRGPFTRPFKPAAVRAGFESRITDLTATLIGRIRGDRRAELRSALAGPLSVAVVVDTLGLREVDDDAVLSWYRAIVDSVTRIGAGEQPTTGGAAAFDVLSAHLRDSVQQRPEDSLVGAAASGRLSIEEVVSDAAVLMFGGIDTTEGMILNAIRHLLLESPGVREDLLAVPQRIDAAVEESIRLEPAAAVVDRYATVGVELGAARVRAGDFVQVSLAGANRDPAVFVDPDRFDAGRPNVRDHLAFAHGSHFCLGMDLARLETRIAVGAVLALPGARLDPAAQSRPTGLVFRKPVSLHVVFD
ncbi:MAG: cytochrome P450 [Mycobacteriales bacterium]